MATRRKFGRGVLGGLMFCSCGVLDAAHAQPALPRSQAEEGVAKLPIMIAGQRVRTVDAHAHCLFQEALDLLGPAGARAALPDTKGVAEHFVGAEGAGAAQRLALMDRMGIDTQVLSINPFWYRTDRNTAAKIVAINNARLSELCRDYPDRFRGFACLTMQDPALAVQQLDDAVRTQGLVGAAIGASVLGESFADPKYNAVWEKAEELDVTIFIHPQSTPELAKRFAGNGWLSNTIGNPLDTTIALQHFIFEGVLERYPRLKLLAAHGGGYLGSYADRSDHACFVSPQNCNASVVLSKRPSAYLNQIYFDSLVFTSEALRHLVAQVGVSQVVLGTDAPIPWELHPVDHVMMTAMGDTDRAAILGGNAGRLFGLAH